MFSSKCRQSGFTLLELMMALAIVALVAAFAIPSMRSILGGSELDATSNQLVFSLQSARSEAIKRITPVSLCPSADPNAAIPVCGGSYTQGWVVFVDANGNGAFNAADDVVIRRGEALSRAFSVTPDERFNNGVTFSISGVSTNVTGVPIGGGFSISHLSKQASRDIRIAASGRISSATASRVDDETNTEGDE